MKKKIFFIIILSAWVIRCNKNNIIDLKFSSPKINVANSIRTLNSLQKNDNIYLMTYYGNYDQVINDVNNRIITDGFETVTQGKKKPVKCSIFSTSGNNKLFGRNFDNPDCGILICLYRPANAYASIGFSRMNDFGFEKSDDPTKLPIGQRHLLLNAPYFTSDGINEHGLSAAISFVKSKKIKIDKKRKTVFVIYLVRAILDQAKNIDEAIAVVRKYNAYDEIQQVSHHLLVSESSGRSAIIEYVNYKWQVVPMKKNWQAVTNSPTYHVLEKSRKEKCTRYNILSTKLEQQAGNITWQAGMKLLQDVSVGMTQWSTIYDLNNKKIYISTYRDYHNIKKIDLKKYF